MSEVHKIATYRWLLRKFEPLPARYRDLRHRTPEPTRGRARTVFADLVHARLLPVRQSIGQFLSAYAPRAIVRGPPGGQWLRVGSDSTPRPGVLLGWVRTRLEACGAQTQGGTGVWDQESRARRGPRRLSWPLPTTMAGTFSGGLISAQGGSYFESTIGGGRQTLR